MSETAGPNGAASAESPKTYTAFFYGTLMAPEVFFTVCFRMSDPPQALKSEYTFRPALLHGYCRRRVRHADYPGITPDAAHQVRGTYVTGLSEANMVKLDYFEGSEYDRVPVKVKLLEQVGDDQGEGNVEGAEVETTVYVFKDKSQLEDKEWDFEHFRSERMKQWTREDYNFSD